MPHVGDSSAGLKIVRAKEHLNALKKEIGEWRRDHLERVPIQGDDKAVSIALGAYRPASPPRWGLLAGDCIANLRASLDHILWEIVAKSSKPRVRVGSKKGRDVQFPISAKAVGVRKRLTELKRPPFNLPADAAKLIKRVQPRKAPYKPLLTLNRLANRDKHCLLLVAITDVRLDRIDNVYVADKPRIDRSMIPEGLEVVAFQTFAINMPGVPPENMKVDGKTTALIALRYPGVPAKPIDIVLEAMIECVERVRDEFLAAKF